MSKNVVIGVIVVLALAVLGWYLTRPKSVVPPTPETQTPASSESANPASSEAMMAKSMVSITSGGFSPMDITVKVGDSVTFENTDTENHTVNSAPHPTHTLYPFLNIGVILKGEKKSVTFEKIGTYKNSTRN